MVNRLDGLPQNSADFEAFILQVQLFTVTYKPSLKSTKTLPRATNKQVQGVAKVFTEKCIMLHTKLPLKLTFKLSLFPLSFGCVVRLLALLFCVQSPLFLGYQIGFKLVHEQVVQLNLDFFYLFNYLCSYRRPPSPLTSRD